MGIIARYCSPSCHIVKLFRFLRELKREIFKVNAREDNFLQQVTVVLKTLLNDIVENFGKRC